MSKNITTQELALEKRVACQDWTSAHAALDEHGYAVLPGMLDADTCGEVASGYASDMGYRSRVVMARHGFGRGEYKYFAYPLPKVVGQLRQALYPHLAPFANHWRERLGTSPRYPETLDAFHAQCRQAGQTQPTPLLLQYGVGDYNCLHQDLYGELVFPLQVAVLLSRPYVDFEGGEFFVTEVVGGAQRAEVVPLTQGDAVVFTVHERPVVGHTGRTRKAAMRHGVSALRSGHRHTLGVIFHDAR